MLGERPLSKPVDVASRRSLAVCRCNGEYALKVMSETAKCFFCGGEVDQEESTCARCSERNKSLEELLPLSDYLNHCRICSTRWMENKYARECFRCRNLSDTEIEERGHRPRPREPNIEEIMEMPRKEGRELPKEIRERIGEISEQGMKRTPEELG